MFGYKWVLILKGAIYPTLLHQKWQMKPFKCFYIFLWGVCCDYISQKCCSLSQKSWFVFNFERLVECSRALSCRERSLKNTSAEGISALQSRKSTWTTTTLLSSWTCSESQDSNVKVSKFLQCYMLHIWFSISYEKMLF